MLLRSTADKDKSPGTESLVIQLLFQQRYSEAYLLLINQQLTKVSVLYNLALCLRWSGNYQAAINRLEGIQLTTGLRNTDQLNVDLEYKQIRNRQDEEADYLQSITDEYTLHFPTLVYDAIIRLKTNCWLQLGNYEKVITVAKPIAHKGYKDIKDALKLADTNNDRTI